MTTKFIMTRDINGYNGFGLPFCDDNKVTTLSTGAAQSITVPRNFRNWLAVFQYEAGSTVFVALNTTAAIPSGSFATSASEINPTARFVQSGNTISFITNDTTAYVGVALYAIP